MLEVRGKQIRKDRKKAGFNSAHKFAQACGLSDETIYRTERTNSATPNTVDRICLTLKYQKQRYLCSNDNPMPNAFSVPIEGSWKGFFLEPGADKELRLVEETLKLKEQGGSVTGYAEATIDGKLRREDLDQCSVKGYVFMGQMIDVDMPPPYNISYVVLKITRAASLMEGYTIWYDVDREQIERSKYMAIRDTNAQLDEKNLELVTKTMTEELSRRTKSTGA